MLLLHSKIYLGADGQTTDALFVRSGRVVAIGDAARELHTDEPVCRPEGACVFPALGDAHIHLWGLGLRAGTVELRGMGLHEIYSALREVEAAPSGWIFGRDWDHHNWDAGESLSIDVLDEMHPETPVCLWRVDGHAVWVNSAALRAVDFPVDYVPGGGGYADRDSAGRFTGKLVDQGMDPLLNGLPIPPMEGDQATFLETAAMLTSFGIASAHMAWMPINRMEMLQTMHGAGELPIRVYLILNGDDALLPGVLAEGPFHDEDAWLSWRSIKFFADGAMGSMGALTLEPYRPGGNGLRMKEASVLAARTQELMENGWQVTVHAIGDAAAREVLDAFAGVSEQARATLRPRLEHAQLVASEDCARFGELNTIASIQPIHLRSDVPWAPAVLADHQLDRLYPWRSLISSTRLAAGSDYPIDDPNPWHGISTALTRLAGNNEVFRPEHVLTRAEILEAYTTGAAYAAHWEDKLGRLDPGFMADIIALDRDPFVESPESIWDTEVLEMWIGGRSTGASRGQRDR